MVTSGLDSKEPILVLSEEIPTEEASDSIDHTYHGLFLNNTNLKQPITQHISNE